MPFEVTICLLFVACWIQGFFNTLTLREQRRFIRDLDDRLHELRKMKR